MYDNVFSKRDGDIAEKFIDDSKIIEVSQPKSTEARFKKAAYYTFDRAVNVRTAPDTKNSVVTRVKSVLSGITPDDVTIQNGYVWAVVKRSPTSFEYVALAKDDYSEVYVH